MNKILSIIIPTYNMASLLPRCLDSLIGAGANEDIEAIVVNDGSKDNSLAVAGEYEARFPECITVIDKPNGNYGSTINAALPEAKGKYVKILDSDDWFDSPALAEFIKELKVIDADMVITHFNILHDDGSKELSKYNIYGKEPYEYGKTYDLDDILDDGHIRFFLMHGITYRTALLKSSSYRQSEGISYTDTQWCAYPLFHARNIVFLDIALYQYNLAREGQTMDPAVILRSLDQMNRMTFDMMDFYDSFDISSLSETRSAFLKQYFRNRARLLAKCYLYDIPRDKFEPSAFEPVDERIRQFISRNGMEPLKIKPENKILPLDFYRYWQKRHRRMPHFIEKVNHSTDIVATKVYRKLFR